jgi:predicted dehydrogenase
MSDLPAENEKPFTSSIKGSAIDKSKRKLRLGMVGGGRGAFIGAIHRMAARLDDRFQLVAGALSSDKHNAKASALDLNIDSDRAYMSYSEMLEAERRRPDGIDVVSIVTPNHLHFEISKAFLEAGINVICDKPMTVSLDEAIELVRIVRQSRLVFVLTQNNTGYPMVRQARAMIREGRLGHIRVVRVSYVQDWLTTEIEKSGQKQAAWRMDPRLAGSGGCIADIGVHAFNLAAFITGLELESVCADLKSYGDGRILDDNANVLLRYKGGATGTLWASQVAPGNNNELSIGVYGEKGGLTWNGEFNDHLRFTPYGEAPRIITRGGPGANAVAAHATRMPPGHPEGYIEGFANLYSNAADLILERVKGDLANPMSRDIPTVEDGARGIKFITACVESSHRGGVWTDASLGDL